LVVSVSVGVAFTNVPLAPESGAANVTLTPCIGAPLFVTTADRAVAYAVPTTAVCIDPPCALIRILGTASLVRLKLADACAPDAVAVTVKAPVVALAVKMEVVARPFESDVSVSVDVPFVKEPLAPLDGAVNVTVTP
jgi:hypothetical protein